MRFPISLFAVLMIAVVARADDEVQPWQVHGLVVDEQGARVEEFEASSFWLANGNWWDEKGELVAEAKAGKLWTNEGVLAPSPHRIAKRLPQGRFSVTEDQYSRLVIFAVDKRRERGGIVEVEQSEAEKPVTIKLEPLVRVTAKFTCSEAGKTPEWTSASVFVPNEKGELWKLMLCGSFRAQASFLLPPGTYNLQGGSDEPGAKLVPPKEQAEKDAAAKLPVRGMRLEVPRGKRELDLGAIDLVLPRDKAGNAVDLTQYYGKAPPELSITDARGVAKTVKLADYRGKWVLLEFWALWCGPCVNRNIPELTKFYEEHAADRDRFQILSVCNTESEGARTLEAYDALAAPLVKEAWGGKQLPFPVLVDGEGKTFGVYGVQGAGDELLIDPEGRLVKGGRLAMLAEKLKEKKP
jgi:thiol-disulfide isomerase/thioredoxin